MQRETGKYNSNKLKKKKNRCKTVAKMRGSANNSTIWRTDEDNVCLDPSGQLTDCPITPRSSLQFPMLLYNNSRVGLQTTSPQNCLLCEIIFTLWNTIGKGWATVSSKPVTVCSFCNSVFKQQTNGQEINNCLKWKGGKKILNFHVFHQVCLAKCAVH